MIKGADPEWKGGSADAQLMIVYAAERFLAQLADRVWEQKVRQTGEFYILPVAKKLTPVKDARQ